MHETVYTRPFFPPPLNYLCGKGLGTRLGTVTKVRKFAPPKLTHYTVVIYMCKQGSFQLVHCHNFCCVSLWIFITKTFLITDVTFSSSVERFQWNKSSLLSRQATWSLFFDLQEGFWKVSIRSTTAAFNAIHSMAELVANALYRHTSFSVKDLPAFHIGSLKKFGFQWTISSYASFRECMNVSAV